MADPYEEEMPCNSFIAGAPLQQNRAYGFNPSAGQLVAVHTLPPDCSREVDEEVELLSCEQPDSRTAASVPADTLLVVSPQLLSLFVKEFGDKRLDNDELNAAYELTDLAAAVGADGFWRGSPFVYQLLRSFSPSPSSSSFEAWVAEKLNRDPFEIQRVMRTTDHHLKEIDQIMKGYAGWLISTPEYLEDQQLLLKDFSTEIQEYGFPTALQCHPSLDERSDFQQCCWRFYSDWNLERLAAPGLPVPVGPGLPDHGTTSPLPSVDTIRLPHYFPRNGSGPLVDMLDNARPESGQSISRIAEWLDLIGRYSASQNKIEQFRRCLALQCHWKSLALAFPKSLKRGRTKLKSVFASLGGVNTSTVQRNLNLLSSRIGDTWSNLSPDHQ